MPRQQPITARDFIGSILCHIINTDILCRSYAYDTHYFSDVKSNVPKVLTVVDVLKHVNVKMEVTVAMLMGLVPALRDGL